MLIDTHCHLHDQEHFPDPGAEVRRALEAGVGRIIVVGVEPNDWGGAIDLAEAHPEVFAIVGWHPNHSAEYESSALDRLEEMLGHPKVLALGEIGLDYHWEFASHEKQHEALRDQLELARRLDKPVVFHAREAYSDLLDVLESFGPHAWLFHCFSGGSDDAGRAVALDATFGIDGPVTYKKADALREIVASLPRDRVVLETDSPYMAPVPYRGKTNRPAYTREIAAAVAAVWDVSEAEVAEVTSRNAGRFFGPRLLA